MRVGIMSMQRIEDYGFFLQAYAVKNMIEELGHDVVFVDYKVNASLEERLSSRKHSKFSLLRSFFSHKRNLTGTAFSDTYERALKELGVSRYFRYRTAVDVLVICGDEIFNCMHDTYNKGFSLELFGKNNRSDKLITYAVSFGETTAQDLKEKEIYDEIRNLLGKFNIISAGDETTLAMLKQMRVKNIELNFNPALVYDYTEVIQEKRDIDSYILIYADANSNYTEDEIESIQEYAQEHGKRIASVGKLLPWTDVKLQASPLELLGYFKNADFVITDSYYGIIFSAVFKKQFAAIVREKKMKIAALLDSLFLNKQVVTDIANLETVLLNSIDYEKVQYIINMQRKNAVDYLINNLE